MPRCTSRRPPCHQAPKRVSGTGWVSPGWFWELPKLGLQPASPSCAHNRCGCLVDGVEGYTCSVITDIFCLNQVRCPLHCAAHAPRTAERPLRIYAHCPSPVQCSGHGDCLYGYCKCHEGWYGMDCARRRASSAPIPKAAFEDAFPKHHQGVVSFPAAARVRQQWEEPAGPERPSMRWFPCIASRYKL